MAIDDQIARLERITPLIPPCRCCGKALSILDGITEAVREGVGIHFECIPNHWGKHSKQINKSRCREFGEYNAMFKPRIPSRRENDALEEYALGRMADAIGGQIEHSGGGIFGVRVEYDGVPPEWQPGVTFYFGFADDVLGWDVNDSDGDLIGWNKAITTATIDRPDIAVSICRSALRDNRMTKWEV